MQHTQTTVLLIDATHPEPPVIEHAAALLRAGELVIFPTETVYGLGADTLQPHAVQHIFTTKERALSDPLIVHIADEAALEALVADVPAQARQLTHAFWPGPLTLVLPASSRVPKLVTAGLDTVAIRMPRHPVALALIRAAGVPVAAPSANRFMHVSPTTAQHALADLNGRVPLVLDGGPCAVGVESTVLDLCSETPTILRPGGVSLEALRSVLPNVQFSVREPSHLQEGQKAPGQLLVHYAPKVPAFLFDGPVEAMRKAILAEVEQRQARGEHVGVLIADEDFAAFQGSGACIYRLGSTLEQVASRLFAGLRVLEESGVNIILCRSFEAQGLGLAIRDRLLKASGGNVVSL
ncbi:MAG: threonylcarbamoyl-AMP synthase [Ktedonobacteraceae bacterium]|nr:threonylcarbamoyl-AMP synthase [Ktedonobacteraceae bacterium]